MTARIGGNLILKWMVLLTLPTVLLLVLMGGSIVFICHQDLKGAFIGVEGIALVAGTFFNFFLAKKLVLLVKHSSKEVGETTNGSRHSPVESATAEDGGLPVSFYHMIRDSEESKGAPIEQAKQYWRIFENSPDMVYITSADGKIIDINPAGVEMLGYESKEKLIKVHPKDFHFNSMERKKYIDEVAKKGFVRNVEARLKRKDGTTIDVLMTVKVRKDPLGNAIGYEGFIKDISDLKRMEEELRKSEERYRTILENIQEGYYEINLAGNFTFVNDAICRHLGYSREELIGMNYHQYADETSAKRGYQLYSRVYQTGEPIEVLDAEIIGKDGTKGTYEMSVSLIRDSEGKPIGFRGISRDVTERKRTEDALRESENKFRSLVENSFVGVYLVQDGIFKYVNSRVADIHGYKIEEMVDKMGPKRSTLPEDLSIVEGNIAKRIKGEEESIHYEFRIVTKSQEIRNVEVFGSRTMYQGRPAVIGTMLDITDRKKAEEALRQSEERYRTILENIQEAYFEDDLAGNLTFFNDALCGSLGYTKEELIGMNYRQRVDEKDDRKLRHFYSELYRTGEPIKALEAEFVRKDGTKLIAEFSSSLIRDSAGKPIGFRGISRDITERKRAEEALRQSEERYRNILESMEEGYYEVDLAGDFTFINNSVCQIFGYPREALMDMNDREYTDQETTRKLFQAFNEVYRTGKPGSIFNYEIIRKDGTKRHVETSISLRKDAFGKPVGFRGIIRDVTEHKRREEEIQRKTVLVEAINNIFKAALTCETNVEVAGMCLTLAQQLTSSQFGFIGEVNEAGYFDTIALSDPGWERCKMPKADAALMINNMEIRGIWGRVIKSREPLIVNQPSSHPDRVGVPEGHPPITAFLGIPLEYSGRTFGMISLANKESGYSSVDQEMIKSLSGAFVEVLMRKRAEEALRQSEERYRNILESMEEGYYEVDLAGNFTFFNDSMCQIFGYHREELIGMNDQQYTDQETTRKLFQALNEIYRTGKSGKIFDNEIIRKDGSKRHVETSISLRKDASGKPIGFRGIIRDITDKKRIEEQLFQAEKLRAVGEMASGVAHDFNNALAAILGNTQLLLYTVQDEEFKETLKIIEKVAKDSSQTVRRLQDFTRKRIAQELLKVDINAVVKDSIEITKPRWKDEAQNRGIHIEMVSKLGNVPSASGNASELREVITNMIFNAIEAMHEGGRIEIRTFRKKRDVFVQISDTGVGITEETKKKIFEPFFTTKPFTNTGLGLSMSYGIVRRFGGEIEVKSKVGQGAAFTITLPIGEDEKDEASDSQPIKKGRRARILVIDDDEFVRSVLSRTLAQADHQVILAENGEKGVQLFKEGEFDVVLTDLGMPGVSGWEVCRMIKEISPHTPVGMITGWGAERDRSKMEEYGLDFFISKPFDFTQILNVVVETMESRKG